MFENANTAEEKLQELLKQSNVKDIQEDVYKRQAFWQYSYCQD